jgi:LuxR family transcriptional regulator, maltose regulon positive regulatory protein
MVAEPVSPDTAERLVEHAFAAAPDLPGVRFACVNALVEVAFRRGDRRQVELFVDRLTPLAEPDDERTAGWVALFRALLARVPDEIPAELAAPSLVSGSPLCPVQDWLRGQLLLLRLGDPAAAEPIARRAMSHAAPNLSVLFRCQLIESRGCADGSTRPMICSRACSPGSTRPRC